MTEMLLSYLSKTNDKEVWENKGVGAQQKGGRKEQQVGVLRGRELRKREKRRETELINMQI